MTVKDALSKWTDAATAELAKGRYVRNANWQPIARALRHFTGDGAALITEVEYDGPETVLLVKPLVPKPVDGAPAQPSKPPFHLIVT